MDIVTPPFRLARARSLRWASRFLHSSKQYRCVRTAGISHFPDPCSLQRLGFITAPNPLGYLELLEMS